MERDSPKGNVFCSVSRRRVFGPFFFAEKGVTGQVYLKMFQNWLMPQHEEEEKLIFQQNGGLPLWRMVVREYLIRNLPGRWIGRASAADNIFCI
jgi:hypothetical protein